MSFRRDSYSIVRLNTLLSGSIKVDSSALLYIDQNYPVKYIKTYGIVMDKTLDEGNMGTNEVTYLVKIDDGTGAVWIKTSNIHAEEIKKWDFVRIIGHLDLNTSNGKDYEISINVESIRKVDDKNWELVHILESQRNKEKTKIKPSNAKKVKDETIDSDQGDEESIDDISNTTVDSENPEIETLANRIEKILRENDSGNGVEFSIILKLAGDVNESDVDDILFELAYEGKVYQPRPDFYKIME